MDGIEVTISTKTSIVKLEGKWTVERAQELKHVLIEALKGEEPVVIELEDLVETDISCLQLLCSAHRTSLKLSKHFTLHGKRPEMFNRSAHTAGFTRSLGCHKDPLGTCLWTGGSES